MRKFRDTFRLVLICTAAILLLAAGVFYQSFMESEFNDDPPKFLFANDFTGSLSLNSDIRNFQNLLNSSDLINFIPEVTENNILLLSDGWNFVWKQDSTVLVPSSYRVTNVFEFDPVNFYSTRIYGYDSLNKFDMLQLKKSQHYWIKLDSV